MANVREAVGTATDFRNRKRRHISQQNHIRATDQRPPSIRNDDDISPPVKQSSDYAISRHYVEWIGLN